MSHFTVLVCLKDQDDLAEALEPFNECTDVEPYRDYEEGDAASFWYVNSLKSDAEHYANGTGILPMDGPDQIGWSSRTSSKTPEEQRENQRKDAERYATLSDPPTWAEVVTTYNDAFYPAGQVATLDDLSGDGRLYLADDGRAYTWSTRNPNSKWDWYQVGGRWSDHFIPRPNVDTKHLINGERSWTMGDAPLAPFRCDGGRKGALNLDAMREEAATEGREYYRSFHAWVAGTPEITPWPEFVARTKTDELTMVQARELYGAQPRIQRLRESRDWTWVNAEDFQVTEDVYAMFRWAKAVPGYATLTLDGRWMAPGDMGWFGVSSDTTDSQIGYLEVANAYLETLDDDVWLVQVDCHI